jgi:hypothetical protein
VAEVLPQDYQDYDDYDDDAEVDREGPPHIPHKPQSLRSSPWNCLWLRGVIFYLDMYEDLGGEGMLKGEEYVSNPVRDGGGGGGGGGGGDGGGGGGGSSNGSSSTTTNTTNNNNNNNTAQFEILHCLYQQMSLHGAVIANHLHSGVTHVVMLPQPAFSSRAALIRVRV